MNATPITPTGLHRASDLRRFVLTSQASRLALSSDDGEMTVLPFGPEVLADLRWPHGLPSPIQLERAIDDVETAIEQAGLVHDRRGGLMLDRYLVDLMAQLPLRARAVCLHEVEGEFSRLVSDAHRGTDDGAAGSFQGARAAALLMLRELMHHLGFQSLMAAADLPTPSGHVADGIPPDSPPTVP